jgi:hypothetical protein
MSINRSIIYENENKTSQINKKLDNSARRQVSLDNNK